MPEAARIGDEISHSQARLGFIVGSIAAAVLEGVASYGLGCALAGLACAFPFGTIAALAIGLVVGVMLIGPAGDFLQSAGEAIGRTFTVVAGTLVAIGASDVFINGRLAIRASPNTLDFAVCSHHEPLPQHYVIEGAKTVFINKWNAARKGDHLDCEATISGGSDNVLIGSPPVLIGHYTAHEISDDLRKYAGYLRMAAGIIGGSLVGAGGLRCFLGSVAMGVGVAVGSSEVLGDVIPHMEYGTSAGNSAGTSIGNWLQGKPVDVTSGAKILPDELDIDLPGAFPLVWSRYYNSRDGRVGILGQGWSTPQSLEIVFRDGQLVFIGRQGRENVLPDPAPNESLYYASEQFKVWRSPGGHYYLSYPGADLIYCFGARRTGLDGERLRLLRAMDLHDNGIDFHYDNAGLLVEMISSAGHVLRLHYSNTDLGMTRLVEICQTQGGIDTDVTLVRYQYSTEGDLTAVLDRSGQVVRRFGYQQHMIVWQQFGTGLQSHYEWDQISPLGRVVRQHGDDGEDLRFVYLDAPLDFAALQPAAAIAAGMAPDGLAPFAERRVRVTDQLGRVQEFVCNRHYLVTHFTNPLGATISNVWDDNRRLVCYTDAAGHRTEFEYDGRAQLAAVRNALGQSARIQWHEQFARIRSVTHYDGSEWQYDYDELGSLVQIRGPQGYIETLQIDERGLPVRRTDAKGGQVQMRYNEQAQLTEYTDCSNKSTRYDYDREGRLVGTVDAKGQVRRYERDALGRITALHLPDGAQHQYRYDAIGQQVAYTDPLGRITHYHRNLRGEVVAQENPSSGKVSLGFDAAFRLAALVNENQQAYKFAYDAADRLIEEQRIDGTRIDIEFDVANRVVAVIHHASVGDDIFTEIEREAEERASGLGSAVPPAPPVASVIRTELVRDALGRLTEKRTPGQHCHYRYDAAGRLVLAKKLKVLVAQMDSQPAQLQPLHSTRFEYDALGNLIAEHSTDEVSGETHTLHHAHDPLGTSPQTLLPPLAGEGSRRALNYLYYGSGHLHQINLSHETADAKVAPASSVHQLIADIERDDLHREILRSQGSIATRYDRDPLGRRTGSLSGWGYGLPVTSGDSSFEGLLPSAADGLRKQYRYDLAGELIESAHSQQGTTHYRYDPLGRLAMAQRSNHGGQSQAEHFAYDPAGNLLDNTLVHSTSTRQPGYVRDNLVRVFEDKRFFYDGFSRLIEKRVAKHTIQRFEWDDEHRLIAVHTRRTGYGADGPQGTTQTVWFDYDALGRRIAKHDRFGTTHFLWSGMRLIEERRASHVVSYVYEPNSYVPLARIDAEGRPTDAGGLGTTQDAANEANPIASDAANDESPPPLGNLYYFHTDQVGLPEELTDTKGHIRWRAAYRAWGNTLAERWETVDLAGQPVNSASAQGAPLVIQQNLRFQGQYLDRDTGLHYNTFRYYDPDIGRFISPDPIGLSGGTNLHSYGTNPVSWIDPWGWCGEAEGASPKEIPISRAKYGEAADHIADAQAAGHPDVLTVARDGASANRKASIGGMEKVPNKQLDEYPPAMFKEGGEGASVRAIDPGNNMGAGACIGNACRGLADGAKVKVKVTD